MVQRDDEIPSGRTPARGVAAIGNIYAVQRGRRWKGVRLVKLQPGRTVIAPRSLMNFPSRQMHYAVICPSGRRSLKNIALERWQCGGPIDVSGTSTFTTFLAKGHENLPPELLLEGPGARGRSRLRPLPICQGQSHSAFASPRLDCPRAATVKPWGGNANIHFQGSSEVSRGLNARRRLRAAQRMGHNRQAPC